MSRWRRIIAMTALVLGLSGFMFSVPTVKAVTVFQQCSGNTTSSVCAAANTDNAANLIKNVINTLLVGLGMVSVIMIVVGGLRYTISHGDSSQTKAARETILYAVIGLVVAILAYAIVNFVVSRF